MKVANSIREKDDLEVAWIIIQGPMNEPVSRFKNDDILRLNNQL